MSDESVAGWLAFLALLVGFVFGIYAGVQGTARSREKLAISLGHARWEVNAKTGETVLVYLVP